MDDFDSIAMNHLLKHYCVDVEFPTVSGAEQLEMLQIRDKLAKIEEGLADEEREALAQADRRLLERADAVYAELSRFVDLAERRQQQQIPASRWWWYLDVLTQLPRLESSPAQVNERVLAAVDQPSALVFLTGSAQKVAVTS